MASDGNPPHCCCRHLAASLVCPRLTQQTRLGVSHARFPVDSSSQRCSSTLLCTSWFSFICGCGHLALAPSSRALALPLFARVYLPYYFEALVIQRRVPTNGETRREITIRFLSLSLCLSACCCVSFMAADPIRCAVTSSIPTQCYTSSGAFSNMDANDATFVSLSGRLNCSHSPPPVLGQAI